MIPDKLHLGCGRLYRPGFYNVDIDKEMADLAENYFNFKFATNKISNYYKTIQNVIKGGTA